MCRLQFLILPMLLVSTSHTLLAAVKPIVVAVIDTGADLDHKNLKEHLWSNPREIKNGTDDDNNGYVDDLSGWNFVQDSSDLHDEHGHGTHIAGLVINGTSRKNARENSPEAQVMILKNFSYSNANNLRATIQAIKYAIQNKADIINISGGGSGFDPDELNALQKAQDSQILTVAAAGNDGQNIDQIGFYPASYNLMGILSVMSLDQEGHRMGTSNFGPRTVDVAAPGLQILSLLPGNRTGRMSGTSQAAALVTQRLVHLMIHSQRKLSIEELRKSAMEAFPVKDF